MHAYNRHDVELAPGSRTPRCQKPSQALRRTDQTTVGVAAVTAQGFVEMQGGASESWSMAR